MKTFVQVFLCMCRNHFPQVFVSNKCSSFTTSCLPCRRKKRMERPRNAKHDLCPHVVWTLSVWVERRICSPCVPSRDVIGGVIGVSHRWMLSVVNSVCPVKGFYRCWTGCYRRCYVERWDRPRRGPNTPVEHGVDSRKHMIEKLPKFEM